MGIESSAKAAGCPLSLALQGGGAHGAFTWGVLDRLLEDGRVCFDGISGTSAGAMNAVVLAQGLMEGGRDGARAALARFWAGVAASQPFELGMPAMDAPGATLAPAARAMLQWTRFFSPYELNPLNLDPLRDLVAAHIDFARLRRESPVRLFIAATHANSGKLRLFGTRELELDMLLASACLPTLHRSVEIAGEPYWDGGYAANPAVFPLLHDCSAKDVLLVLLNPLKHLQTPHTAEEIRVRSLELAFSATFLREMRMIAHARRYAAESTEPLGRLERRLTEARFHVVAAEELMTRLAPESRMTVSATFLEMLRDEGRTSAARWLEHHGEDLGRRPSADIDGLFF